MERQQVGNIQAIRVKWNDHDSHFTKMFEEMLQRNELLDVSLCCDGETIKAHRLVLSAASPYFRKVFADNPCSHPVVIMRDFHYDDVAALVEFMYRGDTYIRRERLREFLRTAQALQIKGLADDYTDNSSEETYDTHPTEPTVQQPQAPSTRNKPPRQQPRGTATPSQTLSKPTPP